MNRGARLLFGSSTSCDHPFPPDLVWRRPASCASRRVGTEGKLQRQGFPPSFPGGEGAWLAGAFLRGIFTIRGGGGGGVEDASSVLPSSEGPLTSRIAQLAAAGEGGVSGLVREGDRGGAHSPPLLYPRGLPPDLPPSRLGGFREEAARAHTHIHKYHASVQGGRLNSPPCHFRGC